MFEVYEGGTCAGDPIDFRTDSEKQANAAVKTRHTTNAQGKFDSDLVLSVSDSDNTSSEPASEKKYSVKEVSAPLGYVANSNNCAVVTVKADAGNAALVSSVQVTNAKAVVPGLPLTGSQAQVILFVVAGVLLAVGVGVVVYRRRQVA